MGAVAILPKGSYLKKVSIKYKGCAKMLFAVLFNKRKEEAAPLSSDWVKK